MHEPVRLAHRHQFLIDLPDRISAIDRPAPQSIRTMDFMHTPPPPRRMATTAKIVARASIVFAILVIAGYLFTGPLSGIEIPGWIPFALLTLMGIGVTISHIRAELYDQRRRYEEALKEAGQDPSDRLRARIEQVGEAFGSAVTLMDELQRDITSQEAAHRQLVEQASHQRALIGMDREEAEAVRGLILGATKEDHVRQKRQQWMFFALGVLMSIPIGVAINLLVP
ncbi:hypothetical protein [Nonomuraea jabiensis]|uniref:hypothetical protein n=1 Tax=Nonomuraea jabiensis TaxID=882448 RepID=UPI003D708956